MNEKELAKILKNVYESARCKEISVRIHLFGIQYGQIIKEKGFKISKIVEMSGIEKGYIPEISKGVKLSEYVVMK